LLLSCRDELAEHSVLVHTYTHARIAIKVLKVAYVIISAKSFIFHGLCLNCDTEQVLGLAFCSHSIFCFILYAG